MNRFRFCKVREVKSPSRANAGDAGLDFYVPTNLTFGQLVEANKNVVALDPNVIISQVSFKDNDPTGPMNSIINSIMIPGHSRIVIPSGIIGLIEPVNSAFIAANKSGVATKKGLVFTAQVVDSPYTGEIHIAVVNTSNTAQEIEAGSKLVQFLHVPLYLTEPEEISDYDYKKLASDWGTRGDNWQGSSDNK